MHDKEEEEKDKEEEEEEEDDDEGKEDKAIIVHTLQKSSKNLLHQRSHHADETSCAAQSCQPDTNLTQPQLLLILHLTKGIASLINAQLPF